MTKTKQCKTKYYNFNAYLIEDGALIDLIDKESGLIRADKIDEISTQIADEFDMLLSLKDFNEN